MYTWEKNKENVKSISKIADRAAKSIVTEDGCWEMIRKGHDHYGLFRSHDSDVVWVWEMTPENAEKTLYQKELRGTGEENAFILTDPAALGTRPSAAERALNMIGRNEMWIGLGLISIPIIRFIAAAVMLFVAPW